METFTLQNSELGRPYYRRGVIAGGILTIAGGMRSVSGNADTATTVIAVTQSATRDALPLRLQLFQTH